MQLISQGAEAKLFKTEYLGNAVIVKERQPKKYRNPKLDSRIIAERTKAECSLIRAAQKAGIRTPLILKAEPKENKIWFEFIEGKSLKKTLSEKTKAKKFCEEAGKIVAKLHSAGIIHGDLTTSNIMLHNEGLVLLDFGLGKHAQKMEDYAVDLLVFKKTFMATHFEIPAAWKALENAYIKAFSQGNAVLSQIQKIEARARYY